MYIYVGTLTKRKSLKDKWGTGGGEYGWSAAYEQETLDRWKPWNFPAPLRWDSRCNPCCLNQSSSYRLSHRRQGRQGAGHHSFAGEAVCSSAGRFLLSVPWLWQRQQPHRWPVPQSDLKSSFLRFISSILPMFLWDVYIPNKSLSPQTNECICF